MIWCIWKRSIRSDRVLFIWGEVQSYQLPAPSGRTRYGEEGPACMSKDTGFAHQFYVSWAWRRCRNAYMAAGHMLCERCLRKGLIRQGDEVHHKIHLTPDNVKDPTVALNWDNLETLCKECHDQEHDKKRWRADANGYVEL